MSATLDNARPESLNPGKVESGNMKSAMPGDTIMRIAGVAKRFGSFLALRDLTFDVERGEILGVAGPNGAGKSTLLNVCTGGGSATGGTIHFGDHDITRMARHACCGLGIGRTFQIPTIVSSLTVGENILAGSTFGRTKSRSGDPGHDLDTILELTGLAADTDRNAGQTDLLTRKRVMLASALATGAELVFMDEPLGGLNAGEIESFCSLIKTVRRERALTFVIVEHKTRALADLSNRILILDFGALVCIGAPDVVLNDDRVVEIYLGKKHSAQS